MLLSSDPTCPPAISAGLISQIPAEFNKEELIKWPDMEEVKAAVFGIDGYSAASPDGFTVLFYQTCWDFVKSDIMAAMMDFFRGTPMPHSFTAMTIVLFPKRPNSEAWIDFRPISLCNVRNKIITKLLTARLALVLPLVVAPNQSGFVKGHLLSDNVLLAQELMQDLDQCRPSPNVAFKLDMAKANDQVH